ncbi:MAG: glutamine--fructose-6-phosphate aminotransferase [isomerizing] [Candidatus Parcubacteria bacterium]|nr:MAG: glutamine--fructose-6-phosphate aminotransferase [isomerizing] [Candidatus Parcubacteria bacterium]
MCGIVGYLGKRNALEIILKGLEKLEYRGYDSCGIVVYGEKLILKKTVGMVKDLKELFKEKIKADIGIGHTRWATHGGVTEFNAHPHFDCQKNIFIVHNGIIENYQELKKILVNKGHLFNSETDSEVIAHLIEDFINQGDNFEASVHKTLNLIQGTFALLIFNKNEPNKIIAARFSSPLVLGIGKNEFILASDPLPISLITDRMIFLDDSEMAIVNKEGYEIKSYVNNLKIDKKTVGLDLKVKTTEKEGFKHYMIKEIFEEPIAIENTLRGRILKDKTGTKIRGLEEIYHKLKNLKRIILTGCGTAYYACLYGKYLFEEFLPYIIEAEIASELRYRKINYDQETLVIAISQSGETIDTLEALKEAKNKGAITFGIINVPGSTIARTVDAGMYTYAGPEMAVASTKALISQITALILIMIYLARKNLMKPEEAKNILEELEKIPDKIRYILGQESLIIDLAKNLINYKNFYFLGRKFSLPVALEGALKLKEISYVHSEAYPAGEMKHGPIALIDENFPVFVIAPNDSLYQKTISNLEEIRARKGKVILISDKFPENKIDYLISIPSSLEILYPLLTIPSLHLFAYYFANLLDLSIDRPRNLAKSVTVE